MTIYIKRAFVITALLAASSQLQAKNATQGSERPHHRPSFESIDTNADKKIDFEEFSAHKIPHGDYKTVFSAIDTDNNGVISHQEFVSHKPPRPKIMTNAISSGMLMPPPKTE